MTEATLAALTVLVLAGSTRCAARAARRRLVRRRLHPEVPPTALRLAPPPPWLGRRLADADLGAVAPQLWAGWRAATAVLAAVTLARHGIAAAAVVALAAVGAALLLLGSRRGRADERVEAALPEALETIARSLRGGASLHQAVEELAVSAPDALVDDLHRVVDEARHGHGLVPALDRWAGERTRPAVRLAVAALALGAEAGGAQARAVDGVAATIRGRLAVGAEVRALSSQARLSGVVIAVGPLVFGVLAIGTDEHSARFLLGTPVGLVCLTVGLGLDAVAAVWMHRLTRIPA